MTRGPARLYPFLLALVPVVHVVAANPGWSTLDDVAIICVAVLAGCGIVYALAALAARGRWGRRFPPLAVLIAVLWFWGYVALADLVGRRGSVSTHLVLFPVALAVTVALVWWLLRRPAVYDRLATFLTLTGVLLVGWSALSIGRAELRSARALRESAVVRRLARPIAVRADAPAGPKRDIYLILLDGYANAQVTRSLLNFDNHVFLDSLRQLGFVVPEVHSNYLHTMLSLPSLLNAAQIADLAQDVGPRAADPTVPNYLVENSRGARFLKSRGYRYVFFPSQWWLATPDNRNADVVPRVWHGFNLRREIGRSDLRRDLRKSSILDLVRRESDWNADDADYVTRTLGAIAEAPRLPGSVFVFAHVLSPHKPYTFDAECRPLGARGAKAGESAYVGQVECLNQMVLKLVTTLLRDSDVPPVILLQADHGTHSLHFDDAPNVQAISLAAARERLGAFGAYYLPDDGAEAFGPRVSVVNVLGGVLRYYLGADLPPAPDDMYLSVNHAPYDFKRVDLAWLARPGAAGGREHAAGLETAAAP